MANTLMKECVKLSSHMKLKKTNMESQKTLLLEDFDDYRHDAWETLFEDFDDYCHDHESAPVHHVPEINGEIISGDERLLNRLQSYGLKELQVMADGNCQFRSLADQIYGSPDHHELVREQVVKQLKSRADFYEKFVTMAYDEYLSKMSRNGEWGDHLTLQAASDWFGVGIVVITTFEDTCCIEILPQGQKSYQTIFLSYRDQVHYNSVYRIREIRLTVELQNKNRYWCWLR